MSDKPSMNFGEAAQAIIRAAVAREVPNIAAAMVTDAYGQARVVIEIARERRRQIEEEGWDSEHDDYEHRQGGLAAAAAAYALQASRAHLTKTNAYARAKGFRFWPWDRKWWKPTTPRRDLVKAGALIVAEIERRDRAEAAALKAQRFAETGARP